MRLFGASDADIETFLSNRKDLDDDFYVNEENWPIVLWFLDISDQFHFTQGICTGANLVGIKAEAEMSGREFNAEQFKGLRMMTRVAVKELNSKLGSK